MKNLHDTYTQMLGNTYGMLTPYDLIRASRNGKQEWQEYQFVCNCSCGNTVITRAYSIKVGKTQSCGCKRKHSIKPGKEHKGFTGYEQISGKSWGRIRRDAEDRQLEFTITISQAWMLYLQQNKLCALSGVNIMFGTGMTRNTASLDRINSSLGYTIDNVQWVHKKLNRMKMAMSDEEFVEWCELVADYNRQFK